MSQKNPRTFPFLPLTIRIETLGGIATPLVLRGTPLPAVRSETFSTAIDNQSAVELALFFGESSLTKNDILLGKFKLSGFPPKRKGIPWILVEFSVDKTCTVTARASMKELNISSERKFTPTLEFSDSFINKVLAEAESTRISDDSMVRQIEAINRANTLIAKAEEQLKTGPNAMLSEAIAALGLAIASGESDRIRDKSNTLDNVIFPFADPFVSNFFDSILKNPVATQTSRSPSRKEAPQIKQPTHPEQGITSTVQAQLLGKIFGGGTFTLDPQLCFVLMPFADRFQTIYDDNIRPTIERAGLRSERADDIRGTNLITWDIWERINRARFLNC